MVQTNSFEFKRVVIFAQWNHKHDNRNHPRSSQVRKWWCAVWSGLLLSPISIPKENHPLSACLLLTYTSQLHNSAFQSNRAVFDFFALKFIATKKQKFWCEESWYIFRRSFFDRDLGAFEDKQMFWCWLSVMFFIRIQKYELCSKKSTKCCVRLEKKCLERIYTEEIRLKLNRIFKEKRNLLSLLIYHKVVVSFIFMMN